MARRGYLRTAEVARQVGCHPNTVRKYEEWGFLPPIPRTRSGYRRFAPEHVDQMHMARTALGGPWPGRQIKDIVLQLVRRAARGDLGGALEDAYRYRALVRAERAQAAGAAELLRRWAEGVAADVTQEALRIGAAAALLGVTRDALRNWERDGLIVVPRDPGNGYRLYGAAELGRLRVIRVLKTAGYSHMALLRMLLHLDRGEGGDLVQVLDTPRPDEDAHYAADHWLSALAEMDERASRVIGLLEAMLGQR